MLIGEFWMRVRLLIKTNGHKLSYIISYYPNELCVQKAWSRKKIESEFEHENGHTLININL